MNGIIIIDKAPDWTSNDVVAKLRGVLHEKRVGHGGTLDPMATGVLPVFVGRATRAASFCESFDKEYIAGMRFGVVTDTQDTTGNVLKHTEANVGEAELQAALSAFRGDIMQVPPMYSAVKIGGKKLYELARRGVEVERPARPVTIFALETVPAPAGTDDGADAYLRVVCSKGTYIRTLVHDIGQALGCGAAMSSLRRTRAGAYGEDAAHPLADVIAAAAEGGLGGMLLPTDSLFSQYPALTVSGADEKKCRNGAPVSVRVPDGRYRVYGEDGAFLLLGQAENGALSTVKSFFEV